MRQSQTFTFGTKQSHNDMDFYRQFMGWRYRVTVQVSWGHVHTGVFDECVLALCINLAMCVTYYKNRNHFQIKIEKFTGKKLHTAPVLLACVPAQMFKPIGHHFSEVTDLIWSSKSENTLVLIRSNYYKEHVGCPVTHCPSWSCSPRQQTRN